MSTGKIVKAEIKTEQFQNAVHVELDSGEEKVAFRYYSDELSFSSSEFIGKTMEEVDQLFLKKDTAYLRS